MTWKGRFIAGVIVGTVVPLGCIAGWSQLNDAVPGGLTDQQSQADVASESDLSNRAVGELSDQVAAVQAENDYGGSPLKHVANLWRQITGVLNSDGSDDTTPDQSATEQTESPSDSSAAMVKLRDFVKEATIVELGDMVRAHGDFLAEVDHTSEGLKITLDSGTSVLLGSRDLEGRMKRFLAVYHEIGEATDLTRLVADARYDHGLAVQVVEVEADRSFDDDAAITSGPVVITYE